MALAKIGNLASDGRPILGLDSRDLLDITLSADPGCFLVPAHVWTPWFAVLGSKSGFDAIQECYADLAEHIFAVETGLSSDPLMNWACSSLWRLIVASYEAPTLPSAPSLVSVEPLNESAIRATASWSSAAWSHRPKSYSAAITASIRASVPFRA